VRSTSMRTSMRPRSAGSSRISKLLLPFLTDAAISRASPLKGTGAFVAAVTLSDAVGAALVVAEGSCGPMVPNACTPAPDASVGVCPVSAPAERSWTVPATTDVGEELAEGSLLAASTVLPLAPCVPVVAAGCAVAAAGSFVPGVVSELPDVPVPVGVAAAVLEDVVVFGATGAVAATAVATVVTGAAVCGFTGVGVGWPVDA
jgi:hypothetical protein